MQCVRMAADRIVMLIDGICFASGTYGELIKAEEDSVKQFFH
jgi:phospholipid/cholesterol/gamma-HCH transport system ATP-binding protein